MTPKRRKWLIWAGIMIVNITAILIVDATDADAVLAYLVGGFLYMNFAMALSLHRDMSLSEHFIAQRDSYAVAGDLLARAADHISYAAADETAWIGRLADIHEATNAWYLVRTSHHDTQEIE